VGSRAAIELLENSGVLVYVKLQSLFVLSNQAGGGEVSGGGTLYMKWGAGLFGPRRERNSVSR
jgi:hypothetical protein